MYKNSQTTKEQSIASAFYESDILDQYMAWLPYINDMLEHLIMYD